MIADAKSIPAIVNDVTIYGNLASVLAHIPFAPYYDSVAKYNEAVTRHKATVSMPLRFDRLEKRILQIEKRQTLTEAELALLRGLIDRVSLTTY
jgi:hypothetical protein